jgi:uncharacterized protein (TIGR02246 family)
MMRAAVLASALAVGFVAATPVFGAGGSESGVDAAWVKAMKANDVDGVVKLYAKDAVAWFPGSPMLKGEKEIRGAFEGLLGGNIVKDAAITSMGHKKAGSAITGWGIWSLTLQPKAGGDASTMTGRYTDIVEKRNGKWVLVVDHASADPPPADTAKK